MHTIDQPGWFEMFTQFRASFAVFGYFPTYLLGAMYVGILWNPHMPAGVSLGGGLA